MGLGCEGYEYERSAEDDKKNVLLSEVKHFFVGSNGDISELQIPKNVLSFSDYSFSQTSL
jgi:hypothetical protein